jgi:hypothetical protein
MDIAQFTIKETVEIIGFQDGWTFESTVRRSLSTVRFNFALNVQRATSTFTMTSNSSSGGTIVASQSTVNIVQGNQSNVTTNVYPSGQLNLLSDRMVNRPSVRR